MVTFLVFLHLQGHDDHGSGTLGCRLSGPVPDGVLGLQAEQEAGGEVVDLEDAGASLRGVILVHHRVAGARDRLPIVLKVSVRHPDDVVDDGEQEPGQVEAGGEHEDAVAPARVQQGRVQVGEVSPSLLGDVLVGDAGAPALLDNPLPFVHLLLLVVGRQGVIKEAIFASVDPVRPLHLGGAVTGLLPIHPDSCLPDLDNGFLSRLCFTCLLLH